MPHQEIGLSGLSFEDSLAGIPLKQPFSAADPIITTVEGQIKGGFATEDGVDATALLDYLTARLFTKTNPLSPTWDLLIADFRGQSGATGPVDSALNAYVDSFRRLLEISTANDDWAPLFAEGVSTNLTSQVEKALDHFLTEITYPRGTTVIPNEPPVLQEVGVHGLIGKWINFVSSTAVLRQATTFTSGVDPISYEEIYRHFFPNTNETQFQADFADRLKAFYDDVIDEDGFFIPGHHVDKWYADVVQDFIVASGGVGLDRTSVSTKGLRSISILLRIFELLTDLIGTMQRVAAAQASYLTFLTDWQAAYTELLRQLPTFTRGGEPLNETGTTGLGKEETDARNELNTLNGALSEAIRGSRSIVQDTAKAIQSNINQSNDAVTQQANIATSIIQQLSTLLGTIFR